MLKFFSTAKLLIQTKSSKSIPFFIVNPIRFNKKLLSLFSSQSQAALSYQPKTNTFQQIPKQDLLKSKANLKTRSKIQAVKQSTSFLIRYDSNILDSFCQIFVSLYLNKSAKQLQNLIQKSNQINKTEQKYIQKLDQSWQQYFRSYIQRNFSTQCSITGLQIKGKNQTQIRDKLFLEVSKHRKSQKETLLASSPNLAKRLSLDQNSIYQQTTTLYQYLKTVFEFLDKANTGFLRGDLHSETIFKINSFIERLQKINFDFETGFSVNDYKKLFDLTTEFCLFGVPKNGIKYYELQSKNNLYQRQLYVQADATQRSFEKFHGRIQSVVSSRKVHRTSIAKHYIIEWLPSVIESIKQQQMRCKMKELDEGRIAYAQYFINMHPQKIASVALSELSEEIWSRVFLDEQKQYFEENQFNYIFCKKLQRKICFNINLQQTYQRQQIKFKYSQKIYDYIINYNYNKSSISKQNLTSSEQDKFKILCQDQIYLKDLDQFIKNIHIFDCQTLKPQQNHASTAVMVSKYQMIKILKRRLPYRYVKPDQRKIFLSEAIYHILRKKDDQKEVNGGVIPAYAQFLIGVVIMQILKKQVKVKNRYGKMVALLVEQKKIVNYPDGIKTIKIFKINEDFLTAIIPKVQKEGDLFLHQERSIPTIIPPLPWVQIDIGGYYLEATNFMRFSQCKIQQKLVKYADLKRFFQALNYLGSIPWKINSKILAVVEHIWSEGGNLGSIPPRYSELASKYLSKIKYQNHETKFLEIKKKINEIRNSYGLKCTFLFKLSNAKAFSDVKYFYFPHNVDFRGRVYPVPPHLNHIGDDLSRGLLLFGKGEKLGKTGLKWLKIHCANLMGQNKATNSEKLSFVDDSLELIKSIGKDPLANRQWLKNQDCWQSLSAIIQLCDALNSPNPQQFVSYLHIHQDGSCNGLQHYAALGRDLEGAFQVNLNATQRPSDIYSFVALRVTKLLEQAIEDPTNPDRQLAKKLKQNIKRKTVKQTVMTSVYGVTFIGARQQIYRQLKDQNFLPEQECFKASSYVAKLTMQVIANLFQGAHEIKQWFFNCAKLIGLENCPIGWITPMGLPVVQPYRAQQKFHIITTVSRQLKINQKNENLPVDKKKQKTAFPPNFVHSLDSTHMLYTAEQCNKRNLSFAAVHDSYWSHAGKIEQMNQILRDQFIKLHSQPILQNLKISFQKRFPQIKFPDIPKRGKFNLQNVRDSVFFFS